MQHLNEGLNYLYKFSTERLHVKYENGEEEVVDVKRIDPEGFTPPSPGGSVCCHCRGGKYAAVILDVLDNKVMHIIYTSA